MTTPSAPISWSTLRAGTPARIGLGRTGAALTTAAHLDFQQAHARARDAVYATLDVDRILADLGEIDLEAIHLHSAAADRLTYLRRPDLGRRLDNPSRQLLQERPAARAELLLVVADGLSANAVNAHAVALLRTVTARLEGKPPRLGPVAVVEGGRVAIGDEIGGLLGAEMVAVLIGERPGLSASVHSGSMLPGNRRQAPRRRPQLLVERPPSRNDHPGGRGGPASPDRQRTALSDDRGGLEQVRRADVPTSSRARSTISRR